MLATRNTSPTTSGTPAKLTMSRSEAKSNSCEPPFASIESPTPINELFLKPLRQSRPVDQAAHPCGNCSVVK